MSALTTLSGRSLERPEVEVAADAAATANSPLRVGLVGLGRTGRDVARYIHADRSTDLAWVLRRSVRGGRRSTGNLLGDESDPVAVHGLDEVDVGDLLDRSPVDAIVDFSSESGLGSYGAAAARRGVPIVSAVSTYSEHRQRQVRELARSTAVLWSPNITLGINVVLLAARTMQRIAPDVDVQIVEEHFHGKREVSGTGLRIAHALGVTDDHVHSVRAGGIVGVHEVIFGFPEQTIRLRHEAISRAAFGAGAVFAVAHVVARPPGLYRMEDILAPYFEMQRTLTTATVEQPGGVRERVARRLRAIAGRLEATAPPS